MNFGIWIYIHSMTSGNSTFKDIPVLNFVFIYGSQMLFDRA